MIAILDPTRPGCEFDVYVNDKTKEVKAPSHFDDADCAQLAHGGEIVDLEKRIRHYKLSQEVIGEKVRHLRYRTEAL